jgi:hypothetical protein
MTGVGEDIEGPAAGLFVQGHELRIEVADVLQTTQLTQDAMVVLGFLREAGNRVFPARVVHGLHVFAGQLPNLLASSEVLYLRS